MANRRPNGFYALFLHVSLLIFQLSVSASGAEPPITAVAFAADGQSVLATSQSGLHVFTWPELQRERTIEASAANLHCIAFSPNGRLVAVGGGNPSEDGIVEVFNWPAGNAIAKLQDHADVVSAVVWCDDQRLLSASIDRQIKLWKLPDADSRETHVSIQSFNGHSRSVVALCMLTDGKTFVSAGVDQSVRVWDVESAKLVRSLNQHTQAIHALALRPANDGLPMVASAAGDRTIRFWQPTIGRMVRYIRLDTEPLNIVWLDETRIAASCIDGKIYVINAEEVRIQQSYAAITGWAYAIAVHPTDGSLVVGGSNGEIRRIDTPRGPK